MTSTLVDSNVLLDIFTLDPQWMAWSQRQLDAVRRHSALIVNAIVLAEVSARFATSADVDRAVPGRLFRREHLPWESAFAAGKAYAEYRRRGGAKRSPLPDFFIGAHAEVAGHDLLTRDPRRYRTYFPTVSLIAPDTYP